MAEKKKVFTFEDQLKSMSETHGIPQEDAVNVFSAYKKTMEDILGAEADLGTKSFELQTPFGAYGLEWKDSEKRINSADGVEYTAPAHYIGNFAFPKWVVDVANKNVDFSSVPSSSEVARSKAA